MNSGYTESDTHDTIQSIVKEVLDQKLPKDQIEELAETLSIIVEEHQNILLDYFDETDQSALFYNQQNINYPYPGYSYGFPFNYQANGFIPNNNYQSVPPYSIPMQANGFTQSFPSTNFPIPPILPPFSSLPNLANSISKSDKKKN